VQVGGTVGRGYQARLAQNQTPNYLTFLCLLRLLWRILPCLLQPTFTMNHDIHRWQTRAEGQFFERKSAFDRSTGRPKHRKAADVAWDVVETLAAMAKADGGELAVGIEDDGTITGVPHGG